MFWERKSLHKANGHNPDKTGLPLLASNIFCYVKKKQLASWLRQDVPAQQIAQSSDPDIQPTERRMEQAV